MGLQTSARQFVGELLAAIRIAVVPSDAPHYCSAVLVALSAIAVAGCARMETAHFAARAGQDALVRDGQPTIISRRPESIVMLKPATRQFQAGSRPTYVMAMYNSGRGPLQFSLGNVSVVQVAGGENRTLKIYSYEELASEERTRQAIQALGAGMAAAGRSMSAANAGYYNTTATVYGPRGVSNVNVNGYDPTAAAIAQSTAAAQNEAMMTNVIETGQRNMAALERTILKDNTLLPGEWYGGLMQFAPPVGNASKTLEMTIQVGSDVHQITVAHEPLGS